MLKKFNLFLKSFFNIIKKIFIFLFVDDDKNQNDNWFFSNLKSFFIALVLALVIRSILYEPFHIPSGSMKPGLKDGDFIFVSKYDFGYSRYSFPFGLPIFKNRIFFRKKPNRWDVLVFRLPKNPSINYIKRLVGLPGDKIQMINGVLHINDVPVTKFYIEDILEDDNNLNSVAKVYREISSDGKEIITLDKINNGPGDNTPAFIVPEGHYFFMGDNRDNSLDSRFADTGFIPEENLIGKARIIFFSSSENPLKFWKWHKIIRGNRIFKKIE